LKLSPAQAAQHLLNRRRARSSSIDFAGYIDVPGRPLSPDDPDCELFAPVETNLAKHHKLILEAMERTTARRYGRLLLLLPPGSAKTTYASIVFPAHYMGKNPGSRIGLGAYGSDLSLTMGRRTRSIIRQDRYRGVFNTALSPDSRAGNKFSLLNGSEYMADSLGGQFPGNRFDGCFVGDTLISTPSGLIRIDAITRNTVVYGYDHVENRIVLGTVRGMRRLLRDDLVRVRTASGREIICTADHPIFVPGRGYTEAELLERGDPLIRTQVREVRPAPTQEFDVLSGVLPGYAQPSGNTSLRSLRRRCQQAALRMGEAVSQWHPIRLLRQALHGAADQRGSSKAQASEDSQGKEKAGRQGLRALLGDISANQFAPNVLLKSMRGFSTWSADAGTGEFALQGWQKLRALVPLNAASDPSTGSLLRGLPQELQAGGSPHRRGCGEQSSREPSDSLSGVSSVASSLNDAVDVVERVCGAALPVYDIQVDDCHNFFANEILAHNCIADDPIKGRLEANSETVRNNTWDEFKDNFVTRLIPGGWLVVIMTHWDEDDPAGRILPEDWAGDSGMFKGRHDNLDWEVLCLQAKCENHTDPLGRRIGEYLWPEWFDQKHWGQYERDQRAWSSLFQQRPRPPEGAFFMRNSFLVEVGEFFKPVPMPTSCATVFAVIDTGIKSGKDHDGTGVVYCVLLSQDSGLTYKMVIADWDYVQIDGATLEQWLPSVFERLEELARECRALEGSSGAWIEDKGSGIVLLQQAENHGWQAAPIDSKLTAMGKSERAYNAAPYVAAGDIKIAELAYNKVVTFKNSTKNHFFSQVLSFAMDSKDNTADDLLDCLCYSVAISVGNSEGF
jgi:hypothetical protein